MSASESRIDQLLKRWRAGDRQGLDEFLPGFLAEVRKIVDRRLGVELRRKVSAEDIVQDAVLDFLRYASRHAIRDSTRFCRLLARVIENTLRDSHDWFRAARRDIARERSLDCRDATLSVEPVITVAERREDALFLRTILESIAPADLEVIFLHDLKGLRYCEVAGALGIAEVAARKRHQRAVERARRLVRHRGLRPAGR